VIDVVDVVDDDDDDGGGVDMVDDSVDGARCSVWEFESEIGSTFIGFYEKKGGNFEK